MSSRHRESPVYWLNTYIEAFLRHEEVIPDEAAYTTSLENETVTLPFFSPSGSSPELVTPWNDGYITVPFATYSVSYRKEIDNIWSRCGDADYTFYHENIDLLFELFEALVEYLSREDETASDINAFYDGSNACPFQFQSVRVLNLSGPTAESDEGGRHAIVMSLRYDCMYDGSEYKPEGPAVIYNADRLGTELPQFGT
jgi:hypothetical protein